ncbi:MAG: acireductone synthase [Xanthomonadales bacterium]|nr:acireductone synthase [Xanthomonadales bacterium]
MPAFRGVGAVLTDIEGTISPLAFVREVLFPYAREALPGFLRAHADDPEVRPWRERLAAELGSGDLELQIAALLRWSDEDRKHPVLKALQGMVWRRGYGEGRFRAPICADALERLRAWRQAGLALHVYSSGSVEAQRLFFAHSEHGDLTGLFDRLFDTGVGPKTEPASYARILEEIGRAPGSVLFLSDLPAELDAARTAGLRTARLVREGRPDPRAAHPEVASFAEIEIA